MRLLLILSCQKDLVFYFLLLSLLFFIIATFFFTIATFFFYYRYFLLSSARLSTMARSSTMATFVYHGYFRRSGKPARSSFSSDLDTNLTSSEDSRATTDTASPSSQILVAP